MTDGRASVNRVCGNPRCGGVCWDNGDSCWHEIQVGSRVRFDYGIGTVDRIGEGFVAVSHGSQLWFRRTEDVSSYGAGAADPRGEGRTPFESAATPPERRTRQ